MKVVVQLILLVMSEIAVVVVQIQVVVMACFKFQFVLNYINLLLFVDIDFLLI